MIEYLNLNGDSGIKSYSIDDHNKSITIEFSDKTYTYSSNKIGKLNYITMVKLAKQGYGLCTFINQNPSIKNNFDK